MAAAAIFAPERGSSGVSHSVRMATRKIRQAFLQMLVSRKIMTREEASACLDKISEELEGPAGLSVKEIIGKLNEELTVCHLEIKGVSIEGKEVYGIVNTVADAVSKAHAARFKDWEMAFFKDILKAICEEDNKGVDRDGLKSMKATQGGTFASIKDKDRVLFMWEAEHWLRKDKHGRVFLGARTFLELGDIIRSHGMDLPQVLYF